MVSTNSLLGTGSGAGPAATMTPSVHFQNVGNFRDLASSCKLIMPGRIYRTASPAYATPEDILTMFQKLGIRQMIDLRASDEIAQDVEPAIFKDTDFVLYTRSCLGKVEVDGRKSKISGKAARRYNLSLLERSRYYIALLRKMPVLTALYIVFLSVVNRPKGKLLAIQQVNEGGLQAMYEILVDYAAPELAEAMLLILEAAQQPQPQVFFCKAGKDRTGLLAMLILSVVGATDEEIIADYVKSNEHKQVALAGLQDNVEISALDRKKFEGAPADAMMSAIIYIRKTYGSVAAYLDKIGFDLVSQERLRTALTNNTLMEKVL